MEMVLASAIILLLVGGYICLLNAYEHWGRRLLSRPARDTDEDDGNRSGVPVLGTVLVAATMPAFWPWSALELVALFLILVDAGGPHWLLWRRLRRSRS